MAILLLTLVLSVTGIQWGLSAAQPWQADSIAAVPTLAHIDRLFQPWRHKYPRTQFLINTLAYKPFLVKWKFDFESRDNYPKDRDPLAYIDQGKINTLVIISRLISALMATATVLALFLTAKLLFADFAAAAFAALTLSLSHLFVLFGHLGNVDIGNICWFAWGSYFAVKSIQKNKTFHFVLMALYFALSACTKDSTAGYIIGVMPAFWLMTVNRSLAEGIPIKKAVLSVFSKKLLLAIAVFLFTYALLQNLIPYPKDYWMRMSHWIGGPGVTNYNKDFAGQLPLLKQFFSQLYVGIGWPMLSLVTIAIFYCFVKRRYRISAVFAILPLLAFYALVVMNVKMSSPRYFLCGYFGLALIAGKTVADWLRFKKLPMSVKLVLPVVIYSLSFLYCLGGDLEMIYDSRCRAERWLEKNIQNDSVVVAMAPASYSPRLQKLNCGYAFVDTRPKTQALFKKISPYADYLVFNKKECGIKTAFDQNFLQKLLEGKLGYKKVAVFSAKYHYPARTIFGIAGWPIERISVVSPEISIYARESK